METVVKYWGKRTLNKLSSFSVYLCSKNNKLLLKCQDVFISVYPVDFHPEDGS